MCRQTPQESLLPFGLASFREHCMRKISLVLFRPQTDAVSLRFTNTKAGHKYRVLARHAQGSKFHFQHHKRKPHPKLNWQ